jgi:hypothetical protein
MNKLFIDKVGVENAEIMWNEIQTIGYIDPNKTTNYLDIINNVEDLYKKILQRENINKRYLIRGCPSRRNRLIVDYRVPISNCILIGLNEERIIMFNQLAGMPGNILCLFESCVELWEIRSLIREFI